ncbi:MAG: TonB-dependent receptor [Hyphomonadaceae bacterium]|nr:TonB-dependent receptor [Hyphomonadaceae bacterium]
MKIPVIRRLALASTVLTALAIAPVHAQDDPDADVATVSADAEDEVAVQERVIVTGSRLRRDEFSSISPLQVVDADEGRAIGIIDIGDLVAQSPTITGVQFDASTNAGSPTAAVEGVSEGGVGSNNIALRGLGASSTLVLMNGRRLGRSGVRGAPVAPDINLIPSALVERVDILTDGASSIYGSDAVAGVVNVILRDDFEGFEIAANATQPENPGGEELQVSFIAGGSFDRGNLTIGGEFYNRTAVLAGDRDNFNDCLRDIEVGTDGGVRSVCLDNRPDNSVFLSGTGFVFSTPGTTDIGVPGFSTGGALPENFAFNDLYNLQDEERDTQLLEGVERYSLYATGQYDLNLFSRDTLYFEGSYSNRSGVSRLTNEQIFPGVPALIPQEDANGNLLVNTDGSLALVDNPINPFSADALPVVTTLGLAQRRSTDVENFRFVAGMEGDIPIQALQEKNWVYDIYTSYERSYGVASQPVLNEFAARESLDTLRLDADGNLVCGLARTATSFGFLTPSECVVVDWFSPTLFTTEGGNKRFATQAEEDFLFGDSINTTELETGIISGVVTGDMFEMPAGTVGLVLGAEFREERIATVNDVVRVAGLGASEVPDIEGNTNGRTSLWEVFAETELPLHERFNLNLAGRYSDTELSGNEATYSVRGDFEVTDYFRIRGTAGTTFRAPDLRALFLAGTVGTIGGGNDPCRVPTVANNGGVYDPTADTRSQVVLDNCVADGVDPTALGLLATTGIPTNSGGNPDLAPETSESYTAGFVFRQPWTDDFDFDLSVTYFNIDVEDRILPTSATDVLSRCYNDEPGLGSPFCDFISRNSGDPAQATINRVDVPFINVGQVTSEGLDFNARFGMDIDRILDGARFSYNLSATHYIEQAEVISDDDPGDDNVGEIGNPEWQAVGTALVEWGNWNARLRTRFIGETQQDDTDAFTDPASQSTTRSACGILGANVACTDVDFTDDYWTHDLAIGYNADSWTVSVGVRNVFDEQPPLIDQGEGPSRLNIVTQSGYDLIGRRAFINVSKRF